MDTIRTRLSILIALLIIGYFVWQLTRPNETEQARDNIKASVPVNLLTTVEAGLESSTGSAGLAMLELFQDRSLDAAGTYLSYLSGDFTPRFKPDLANMNPGSSPQQKPPVKLTANSAPIHLNLAAKGLIDVVVELAPVDPKAGPDTLLALDSDNRGLILLPVGPENAAKRTQKTQFKVVLPLAGTIPNAVSLWHPETDAYMVCGADGRVMMLPASEVVGSTTARQAASFGLVTSDGGYTISLQPMTGGSSLGFLGANKRMEALSLGERTGISRFELRDPVDSRNLLAGRVGSVDTGFLAQCRGTDVPLNSRPLEVGLELSVNGREGFEVDSSEDSSREIRDKRWVKEQIDSGELDSEELDIEESFQVVAASAKPSEMVLNAAVDNALNDVFQPNTGKVFSDMMAMDKKDRESQLDNQVFQKLEKAKMDPGIKSILDYNEARYDVYKGENERYETKIENQTAENTKRLDQMISDLDRYKIQKLAQEYYYLKMVRDDTKGRTLPIKK